MNILINLLAYNGYIIVNKSIIKKLGLHEAIILGELCSEYAYWEKNNKLDNGYFYSTRENIEENTGLTPYQQRVPLAKLEKMGIVLVKRKGMPLQKWYSLNMDLLFEILKDETDLTTSCQETSQQDVKKLDDKSSRNFTTSSEETLHHVVKKLDINNNNNNNKKNKNEDDNAEEKKSVHITEKQYNNLIKKYGKTRVDKTITRLDLYKKSTGKKYEDDYSTILLWIDSDIEKEKRVLFKNSNIDTDIKYISKYKVMEAYKLVNKPCISLDCGFWIDELDGFPRAFVNFALDTIGIAGILKLMEGKENRSCRFTECLSYMV